METKPTNLFHAYLNSNDNLNLVKLPKTGNLNTGNVPLTIITNMNNTNNITVGMRVKHLGASNLIQAGTTVASVDSATQVTLSQATSAGGAVVDTSIEFLGPNDHSVCQFNVGSILNQAPNAQELESRTECLVKIKYFTVAKTREEFTTDTVSTIQVRVINQYPNNIETQPQTGAYSNIMTSNIIAVFSSGNTNYKYSDLQINPNDYVCVGNIFNGSLTINLTNEDGDLLSLVDRDWNMFLCVYFPPTEKINMNNMPIL